MRGVNVTSRYGLSISHSVLKDCQTPILAPTHSRGQIQITLRLGPPVGLTPSQGQEQRIAGDPHLVTPFHCFSTWRTADDSILCFDVNG